MTNAKLQAANDIARLATTFRGILTLADDLAEVGSIEQAGAEARKQLDNLTQQIKEKQEMFRQLLAQIDAEKKAANVKMAADFEAAKEEVSELLANAKDMASTIVSSAQAEASVVVDEAKAMHDEHMRKAAEWRALAETAKVDHAGALRDAEDAKREHGRLLKMIEDIKAKF